MAKAVVIVLVMAVTIETTNGIRNKHMTANVTQTLDYLLASNRYDKRLRPSFGDSPVTISVNFFIKSMGPVSDNDQSFGIDCYFRQHWYDLRLRYQKFPGLEEFSMSWLFLDKVWKPDTYFINGKRSFLHRITVPNKFLRLRYDGFITYSMRLTITASCPMYLRKFPLDAQRCPLVLGSYGYTSRDLVYRWTDEMPIGLQQGVEIAQFDLVNITTENEKTMFKGGLSYSTVQANFWLKRHTGYFLLQVYIPCGLIVVCSWISFWIDPDAVYVPCGLIVLSSWVSFWIDPDDVAARVALGTYTLSSILPALIKSDSLMVMAGFILGVTTVLSLTTMGFGGRAQLPKVSYWTALDWFVIICFTSVFSVMIEYAIVNFIDKFKKDFKKIIQRKKEDEEAKMKDTGVTKTGEKPKRSSCRPKTRSASFSFSPSKSEKTIETAVQVESKTSKRNFPQKLRPVAYFHPPETQRRSKSIPNLNLEIEQKPPRMIVTNVVDDLIDLETETETELEAIHVVLDVQGGNGLQWETVKQADRRKKLVLVDFLRKIKRPRELWPKIKLPGQTEIINFVEGPDSPNKFSRIDVQSRRNFPIAFFLSLIVYLYAFSYYLTDDIPVRNPDFVFINKKL